MDGIEFRWLEGEHLTELEPSIRANGWVPLNPALARALVAYDGDVIVGYACFSCIPHVEPLFLSVDYRGKGLAEAMADTVVKFLYEVNAPEAYIVASSPHAEQLALKYGMELVKHPVYYKRGN